MKAPEPGPEQAFLHSTLGEWMGDATTFPNRYDPAGGTARIDITRALTLNGFGVVEVYRQIDQDGNPFDGHSVTQYDAATGQYIMHWFDFAGHFEFRGHLEGRTLTLLCHMPDGIMRAICDFNGTPHAYGVAMDLSRDGAAWQPMVRSVFARAQAQAAVA